MNFELTEAQEEIVRQVRTLCGKLPGRVLARSRSPRRISPRLLRRGRRRRLPRRRHSGALRRQRTWNHRGRPRDARGRRVGRCDGGRQRGPPLDLRRQPARLPWQRGTEAPLPAEGGQRRDARRVRRHRARRRQRHHAYQDGGAPRRRQLHHQRPQGLHHQGARSQDGCSCSRAPRPSSRSARKPTA